VTVNRVRYLLGLCSFCWRPAHGHSSSLDSDRPDETIVRWRTCRRHGLLSITRYPMPDGTDG
jgi:hypothetical protein